MKYITGALVILALFNSAEQVSAIKINSKAKFTDDLVKSLAEEMQKDMDKEDEATAQAPPAAAPAKPAALPQHANAPAAHNATNLHDNKTAPALTQHKNAPAQNATVAVQKKVKHEEEEIPMDAAAIKAYSSVIADAAEDSEPAVPVQYSQVISDEEIRHEHEILGSDPIGSMVQNEITSIKMASIKASEDN